MNKLEDILARAAGSAKSGARTERRGKDRASGSGATGIFTRLGRLYAKMEAAYKECAETAGLRCEGCENNCCTSFFQHHTHIEWAYLWRGLQELPAERRKEFVQRAHAYVEKARQNIASGRLPDAMCPLNEQGLCALYSHRLMICRLHGTRNLFRLPNGGEQVFPGCFRFTALPCAAEGNESNCPTLDRTPLYGELASLEMEYLRRASRRMSRVDMTLAEMLVLGPPQLR